MEQSTIMPELPFFDVPVKSMEKVAPHTICVRNVTVRDRICGEIYAPGSKNVRPPGRQLHSKQARRNYDPLLELEFEFES